MLDSSQSASERGGGSAQSPAMDIRKLAAVGQGTLESTPLTEKRQRAMENQKTPSQDDAMAENVKHSPVVENQKGGGGGGRGEVDESSDRLRVEEIERRLESFRLAFENLVRSKPPHHDDELAEEENWCFRGAGKKRSISEKDSEILALPDSSFTPIPNFKDDEQLHKQLGELAGDSIAYFNTWTNRSMCFQGIETVASIEHDGTHYLFTIRVEDLDDFSALKIVKSKVVDGIAVDVEECKP